MTAVASTEAPAWAVPAAALAEWLTLAAVIDQIGAVPCRTSDPEACWPGWQWALRLRDDWRGWMADVEFVAEHEWGRGRHMPCVVPERVRLK